VATKRFFGFMKPQITKSKVSGDIQTCAPPDRVGLTLARTDQLPFEALVRVGDQVKSGQPLAATASKSVITSPVSGKVLALNPQFAPDGTELPGIQILCDVAEDVTSYDTIADLKQASADEIIEGLTKLGIPCPWKTEAAAATMGKAERTAVHTVLVMAIDREPGLSVQSQFLGTYRDCLADSLDALRRITGTASVQLAVPKAEMARAQSDFPGVTVVGVSDRYPENHWQLVLAKVAGVGNTSFSAAREAGYLVLTAEDVTGAGRSLTEGRARVTKLVTVTGKSKSPVTVEARMGSPISSILKELDIEVADGDRVMLGGAWSGFAQYDVDAPISHTSDGITVIAADQITHFNENTCINCGRCTQFCPVGIQVNLTARFAEFNLIEDAIQRGASACIECGVCAYVCPAHRPLVQYLRYAVKSHQESQAAELAAETAE
jgi:H+/Na+-translocating ferredoxin:NAD+ oxidoreductase subunit C